MNDQDSPRDPAENEAPGNQPAESAPAGNQPPSSSPPTDGTSNPPPPTAPPAGSPRPAWSGKTWASLLHFSQLGGYLVPGLGFAAPIVIWLIQKDRFPELDVHGRMVTNWLISLLIYTVAVGIVGTLSCGIGYFLYIPLGLLSLIFPIIGGIKANEGAVWAYPLTFDFIK